MLTEMEWQALALSARVGLWATVVCLLPGLWCGWLLARKEFAGKPVLEAILFLPMVLPPTVPGYLLLVLFGSQGVIGSWLLEHFDLQLAFNWKGAVLASATIAFPLMVQAARIAVQMIDSRIECAARTLGSSPLKIWFTVTLPLALPGIMVGAIMVFSRSLGEFGATITFVGNIMGETQTLPIAIYSATHQINGDAIAMRLIGICLCFAFFALLLSNLLQRRVENWLGVRRA
ncbi:MAG TPA: molybdate ABC transporter permease subunit [Dongiaceae bacterium]|nr:molybdate ABC transporter permease subunit [Dongiaceae bacterium]